MDKHLLHLWDTHRGLLRRLKRQKHNRRLRLRIVTVTREAEEYATELSRRNWDQKCNELQGTLGFKRTWVLLWALIDPTTTKTKSCKTTQNIAHRFEGTDWELLEHIKQRYIDDKTNTDCSRAYTGEANPALDEPITTEEVQHAMLSDKEHYTRKGWYQQRYDTEPR
ncbi:hypothetical protein HPB51_004921 [Rhipicephalus microplus]|uniref:Tick transposon n=1 Tax=Rhipicephalus microplus TaxID=6941 RepID=A0A9J6EXC7_RHIMP|nr:hypothetical protein HPB51_004921 [Rhipicephalus microplus]